MGNYRCEPRDYTLIEIESEGSSRLEGITVNKSLAHFRTISSVHLSYGSLSQLKKYTGTEVYPSKTPVLDKKPTVCLTKVNAVSSLVIVGRRKREGVTTPLEQKERINSNVFTMDP